MDTQTQRTILNVLQDDYLLTWLEAFLVDRKAGNAAIRTIDFYKEKLALFASFCEGQAVTRITQIDANLLRQFLLWLEATGHNSGGRHAFYRCLRAFLNWWELEAEPEGWRNPIKKVKAPKVGQEILEPVELSTVTAMLDTCKQRIFTDLRDAALLLALLDIGARAAELLAINLSDIDLAAGRIRILHGKGDKGRIVYLSEKSRKALRSYLKACAFPQAQEALWRTVHNTRLSYDGLREILGKRAALAGVNTPSPHMFRRACALSMHRNGADLADISYYLGHSNFEITRRYLKIDDSDIQAAHRRTSPVDNM